ncbi:MATE family efflux transporter [Clostridium sp. YIM B02500]|uniref:MATE family efflux transporter n=1 Tax=Clostridium sp. YIM B02500 TaxID=2910681 RepID=UPI001EEF17D1|nr:MATE family efflux transporter [Clostridium sp. YIM B02500]
MFKKFLKYSIPSASAMFVSSLYTVIDGIFVGRGVGDLGLAAVAIAMPATIVLFGIATMFAVGGGALVSKNFGAKDKERAVYIFRQAFKSIIILSSIISFVFIVFSEYIVVLLGATENLKELSAEFLRYYSLFCIPSLLGITLNGFIRNDGGPKLAMISTIAGTVVNILLDYIFIFPLNMGVRGAAIATGLGQVATIAIILPHFLKKKGQLTFGNVKLEMKVVKEIITIGFPSFFAEAAFSIIIFFYNIVLGIYMREEGIASYSIINYITTNIYMMLLGVSLGAQPLISYYFGARDTKKMFTFYKFALIASVSVNLLFTLVCFIFGKNLIGLFTTDKELINIAYIGLNMTNLAYFFTGLNLSTSMYYQSIEMPKFSNLICAFRSFVFLPVILFLAAHYYGTNGIWVSMIFSEILTFLAVNIVTNTKTNTKKAISV